jgi:hypothetical protein
VGDRGCLVGLETATDQPQDGPNPNWVAQLAELQLELGGGLRVVDRNSEQETWTVQFANGRQNVIPHRLADLLIVELDV